MNWAPALQELQVLSTPSDHHLQMFVVIGNLFAHYHEVEQLHRDVPQQARVQQLISFSTVDFR